MDDSFREFILDQLRGLGAVRCRPMFGGHGLYRGERMFGILFKGRIYFKVSAASKGEYAAMGSEPFRPSRTQTLASFYEVPAQVVEGPWMVEWARAAVEAAGRGPNRPRG